jgi:hypothetical protein
VIGCERAGSWAVTMFFDFSQLATERMQSSRV